MKEPIALRAIESKIKKRLYRSADDFLQDVALLRDNCYKSASLRVSRCPAWVEHLAVFGFGTLGQKRTRRPLAIENTQVL